MARRRTRKQPLRRLTAGSRPFAYLLVGLVVVLSAMSAGPLRNYTAAADRVDALEATRDKLYAEVNRLEERRERLQDPDELEIIARQELGLVKPGEIPFIVVTPPPDVEQVGPDTADVPDPDVAWYHRIGRTIADLFS